MREEPRARGRIRPAFRGRPTLSLFNTLLGRVRRWTPPDVPSLLRPGAEVRIEQALIVAAVSMLLFGLGGWLWWLRSGFGDGRTIFLKSVLFGSAMSFALWLAWLLTVYAVLQR